MYFARELPVCSPALEADLLRWPRWLGLRLWLCGFCSRLFARLFWGLLAGELIHRLLKLEDLFLSQDHLLLQGNGLSLYFEDQLRGDACRSHLGLVLLLSFDKVDALLQLIEPPFNIDDPEGRILFGSR